MLEHYFWLLEFKFKFEFYLFEAFFLKSLNSQNPLLLPFLIQPIAPCQPNPRYCRPS
jgi:hypothetical protein